ncbi:hypothetical protein P7K49_011735, partial [Saguinus oedipus]
PFTLEQNGWEASKNQRLLPLQSATSLTPGPLLQQAQNSIRHISKPGRLTLIQKQEH